MTVSSVRPVDGVYLDNAATSFPKAPGVIDAIAATLTRGPSTAWRRGHAAAATAGEDTIAQCRESLLRFLDGGMDDSLIFTSGATDSINGLLRSALAPGDHVVTGPMEHSAVSRTLVGLSRQGMLDFSVAPLDASGVVSSASIAPLIRPNTALILLCHASNVTGDILVAQDVAELAANLNIRLALDVSQSIGAYPLSVKLLRASYLFFSAHKSLLGPPGIGGLYVRRGAPLSSFRFGGIGVRGEPDFLDPGVAADYEPGTPNVPAISGLLASLRYIDQVGLSSIIRHKRELLRPVIEWTQSATGVKTYGRLTDERRVPMLSFNMSGLLAVDCGAILENGYGIVTRSGLHCSPWAHRSLGTLPHGTVRISPGAFSSKRCISLLLEALAEIADRLPVIEETPCS